MDADPPAATLAPLDCTVPESLVGARLDRALATLAGSSRRLARLALGEGRVWLGSRRVKIFTREVRAGQRLRVLPVGVAFPRADKAAEHFAAGEVRDAAKHCAAGEARNGAEKFAAGEARNAAKPCAAGAPRKAARNSAAGEAREASASTKLQIVFLDPWVVVVNKPAGLLSEPDRFGAPSAASLLPALLRARGEGDEVWLVHRLDAGTSGLLLFARRRSAARRLFAAFAARAVDKTYHAVVAGALRTAQRVDAPLQRLAGTRQGVHPDGKPARTHFAPLLAHAAYTLVQARPTTGRTHQIRVHAASLGHPILGDALYGGPRYVQVAGEGAPASGLARTSMRAVSRPLLHAYALKLAHPSEQTRPALDFTLPAPADFAFAVGVARSPASGVASGPTLPYAARHDRDPTTIAAPGQEEGQG